MKLKSPEYKKMNLVLRERLGICLGKTIFSIFLFALLSSLMSYVSVVPVLQNKSVNNICISAGIMFCALTVSFTVVSGLVRTATKRIRLMEPGKKVLFSGFDDRRNINAGIFYAFLFVVSAGILFFIVRNSGNVFTSLIPSQIDFESEKDVAKLIRVASIFSAMLMTIFVILVIPFVFTWNVLIDYKDISAPKAIIRSASLMSTKYFNFIGYIIYSIYKNVIMIIFITALDVAVFSKYRLSSLSIIVSFYTFLQQYTIYSKILFCIPIYYYSLLSVNEILPESCDESSSE